MNENKAKVLGIGISGLVGSRMVEVLSDRYAFKNLSMDTGVDITRPETLGQLEDDTEHHFVILMAAKADVDGCEADRVLGENGAAWNINVNGTRNVVNACLKDNKKLLYISTDFVFDGQKTSGDFYVEEDKTGPVNWYGETKLKGEEIVKMSGLDHIILRLAYPYRTPFSEKKDLVQALLSRLQTGQEIHAVTDHLMTPTFVDDFAESVHALLSSGSAGTYHTVGSETISPFDLAYRIAEIFDLDTSLIKPTTRDDFFHNRAPRPFNLSLRNERIQKLGVGMKSLNDGLRELKNQLR